MKDPWVTLGRGLLIKIDERQRRKYLVREWMQKMKSEFELGLPITPFSDDNHYTPRTTILVHEPQIPPNPKTGQF